MAVTATATSELPHQRVSSAARAAAARLLFVLLALWLVEMELLPRAWPVVLVEELMAPITVVAAAARAVLVFRELLQLVREAMEFLVQLQALR